MVRELVRMWLYPSGSPACTCGGQGRRAGPLILANPQHRAPAQEGDRGRGQERDEREVFGSHLYVNDRCPVFQLDLLGQDSRNLVVLPLVHRCDGQQEHQDLQEYNF